jgi:flagellar biogenesis protein FliO
MKAIDIINIVGNLSIALSFIIALVFGITQMKSVAKDRKERLTLETLRNFQSREFLEFLVYINQNNMPSSWEEWQ